MSFRHLSTPPVDDPLADEAGLNKEWWRWYAEIQVKLPFVAQYTVTIDPGSVSARGTIETTVAISNVTLTTGDAVVVNKPSLTTGIGVTNARATATGGLAVQYINTTTAAIDPPSETYKVIVTRS